VALVSAPTGTVTKLTARWSGRFGQPQHWPTLESMGQMAHAAGFTVIAQQRIVRLLLPSMLHILERPLAGVSGLADLAV
jgi:hypothetical protein